MRYIKAADKDHIELVQDIGAAELLPHVQTNTFEHFNVEQYTFLNFGGDILLNFAIAHQLLYSQLTCTTPTFTPALHKLTLIAVDRAAQNFRTHAKAPATHTRMI